MKVEVEITRTEKDKKTVDVEFPVLFSRKEVFDSGGWFETHEMFTEDGTCHTVTKNDRGWEFEANKVNLKYALGERFGSDYSNEASAADFYRRLDELAACIAKVPR